MPPVLRDLLHLHDSRRVDGGRGFYGDKQMALPKMYAYEGGASHEMHRSLFDFLAESPDGPEGCPETPVSARGLGAGGAERVFTSSTILIEDDYNPIAFGTASSGRT